MSTKETVVTEQIKEKLKKVNQLAENLHSEKGLTVKKINKLLLATSDLQESLAVFKYLKSLPEKEHELLEEVIPVSILTEAKEIETETTISKEEEIDDSIKSLEEELSAYEETNVAPIEEPVVVEELPKEEFKASQEIDNVGEEVEEENAIVEDVAEIKEEIEELEKVLPEEPVAQLEEPEEDSKVEVESETENQLEVNERAALMEAATINSKIQRNPISDLRSAIGLNERFLYANELFNGNMEAFNLAINELNHIESLEDAFRIIDLQLKPKFNWVNDAEVTLQFIDLVERRFL